MSDEDRLTFNQYSVEGSTFLHIEMFCQTCFFEPQMYNVLYLSWLILLQKTMKKCLREALPPIVTSAAHSGHLRWTAMLKVNQSRVARFVWQNKRHVQLQPAPN